jgi:hypothetical protein
MKKSSLILALACALSAWTAIAQPPDDAPDQGTNAPPAGGPHHGRRGPPMDSVIIKALDANGDGILEASEIANAPAALLKLDKNGDGQLTPDEYLPPRPDGSTNGPPPGPGGRRPPRPPIIAALDVNGDGIIDAQEIANAPAELLKLDKNGDGQLTPNEWRPHRPPPDGPPPGDGGGDGDGPPKDPPPEQ